MKCITICAEWIKDIQDGHCKPWNYNYKKYVFHDDATEASDIRIPQSACGIKAIVMQKSGGIADEYDRVYLDNDGDIKILFDVRVAREEALQKAVDKLTAENNALRNTVSAIRNAMDYSKNIDALLRERGGAA